MATFSGNNVQAAAQSGGPTFVFDTITALAASCSATKIVFGNDAEIAAAWSFNTGALDDGTPRVTLATNDPAVAALEAIESYLDTEVAAILTGVQLIDDAVETNRFAVNLISGQIGVTAGAGVAATNTPRVTIATDDLAVTTLSSINTRIANIESDIDSWNSASHARVSPIDGFSGIDGGAGASTGGTTRVVAASNSPDVVALQIIDDWDESDRAKVNLIVGQAGVTGGAGAVALNTPRVTLASDDPAVTSLNTLAANTLDYDTGAGTDTQVIVGIALPASGGAVAGGTATNPIRTDPTGTTPQPASQSGTWNITNVSGTVSLPTGAATDAKLDTIITAVEIIDNIVSGAEAQVDVITSALPTGASTLAEQQTQTTALQLIDNTIIAHDATASGASVNMVGLEGRNTEPTAVGTTGDATRALATMLGKQITVPYSLPVSTWQYASVSGGITDTSDDVAKAAGAAGIRNYITHCSVINASSSVSTEVVIKDGTTVIWRGWAQANGGGVSEKFDPPLRGTAATAVNVTNITTGAQTYFNLQGYVAAE